MKRCKHEIACKMLEAARKGELQTNIMYKARLTWLHTVKFLKKLNGKGFMEKRGEKWFTTDKGKRFIEVFRELEKLGEDTRHE